MLHSMWQESNESPDGISIGKALIVLSSNVRDLHPRYELKVAHKEILDEAESKILW